MSIFTAEKGKGAKLNGKRQRVSKISSLKHAYLTHSSVDAFEEKHKLGGFLKLYKLPRAKSPRYCILSLHELAENFNVYAFIPRKYVFAFTHSSPIKSGCSASEYKEVYSHRGYGDAYGYQLLIKGRVDIMVEAKDKIHDIAALALIVQEAGGKFTDFSGKFSLTSDNAVATNGLLHDQVLKILNS